MMPRLRMLRWVDSVWLAVVLSAIVVVPRSALVAAAHSETVDEEYHLSRGVRFWTKSMGGKTTLNDPPLGAGVVAAPLVVIGTDLYRHVMYGQDCSPETLRVTVAVWKALLFLPLVAIAFLWLRELYGLRSAWLGAALLTLEPNFAGHVPPAALDVLAVEGIVLACWLAWRYASRPSLARAFVAAAAVALAVMLKHTAIILPGVVLAYALIGWARDRSAVPPRDRLRHSGAAVVVGLLAMWALTLFDIGRPYVHRSFAARHPTVAAALARPLPGGIYLTSFVGGMSHAGSGHPAYLLGEKRATGWWSYFPIVSTYKVPIPVFVLATLSLASLATCRPRWQELALLVPMLAWTGFAIGSNINIGFRHFLPAYVFILMLSTRCVAGRPHAAVRVIGALAVVVLAIETIAHHPNYISYTNFPRHKPYLAINDSNVDWGQSLKQVRRWLDANPQDRPVYLRYFGRPGTLAIRHELGDRVQVLNDDHRPPVTGILIISPYHEAGVGDPHDRYALLRPAEPVAVIGDCMRVYDLDRVKGWKSAHRRRPATAPTPP